MPNSLQDVLAEVKKLYNTIPYESYGVDFSVLLKSLRNSPQEIQQRFATGEALEVGCGAGHISLYLAKLFSRVTAVDISEKSLEYAKGQAAAAGTENIQFLLENLFDEKFLAAHTSRFDYILCYGVLHHTHDPKQGFANLVRLLRPGGILTVGVYSRTMLKYRLQRKLVLLLAGNNWQKREAWARKLFGNKRLVTIFDSYVHPQVSFHAVGEVLSWGRSAPLAYMGSWPPVEMEYYFRPAKRALDSKFEAFNYHTIFYWLVELAWLVSGKSVMVNVSFKKPSL